MSGVPIFLVGLLLGLGALVASGPAWQRMSLVFAGTASIGVGYLAGRARVTISGGRLLHQGPVRSWQLELQDVRSVEVPKAYRLSFLVLSDGRARRTLPVAAFRGSSSLAGHLLTELPAPVLSSAALTYLRAEAGQ